MNMFDLQSRKYLITGGAGFLGVEHAKAIIRNNGVPILLDISKDSLMKAKTLLKDEFSMNIKTFICDISNEKDIQEIYEELLKVK